MYSTLSISAWNINGLNHKTLGNKLLNSDFINDIKDHDFTFLTETGDEGISSQDDASMQPQRIYTIFCCSNGNTVRRSRR